MTSSPAVPVSESAAGMVDAHIFRQALAGTRRAWSS